MSKSVTIFRSGNAIVIDPTTRRVHSVLAPLLTYEQKDYAPGSRGKKGSWNSEDIEIFEMEHKGRIATTLGMLEIVIEALEKEGYKVRIEDISSLREKRSERLKTNWDNLYEVAKLRHRQDEFLLRIVSSDNGRLSCPPGYGKSKSVMFLALILPKARFLVTTKTVEVAKNRLYPELVCAVPDVGLVCGGKKQIAGNRIIICTLDSLHHINPEWPDYVIHDECHQAGADKTAGRIARFSNAFLFGLSGSQDMRDDGGDALVQALYGPVRFHMDYQEALVHGLVGQIDVHFRDVIMDINPCEGCRDVDRKKFGIWRNEYRNKLIIEDALYYSKEQVLITCSTLEHVIRLHHLYPEIQMLYHPQTMEKTKGWYYKRGLLSPKVRLLDHVSKEKLVRRLARGDKGVYATTPILNVGFDPKKLGVLIRAEGGSSGIADTQVPGRISRRNEFKSGGILRDYLDQFDSGFGGGAKKRIRHYEFHGWQVHLPESSSRFARRFGFHSSPLPDYGFNTEGWE